MHLPGAPAIGPKSEQAQGTKQHKKKERNQMTTSKNTTTATATATAPETTAPAAAPKAPTQAKPVATKKAAVKKVFIFVAVEPDLYRLTIGSNADSSKIRKLRNHNAKEIKQAVENASNFAGRPPKPITLKKADLSKFGPKAAPFTGLKAFRIA